MSDQEWNEHWDKIYANRKIVIFDIDDVLMPWAQKVHEACVQAGLAQLTSTWTQWHMWKDYGCSQEEWLRVVDSLVVPDSIYHGEPYPYARLAVRTLLSLGHGVHLVTARGFQSHADQIREWTQEWVDKHFPFLPKNSLWFAQDKGVVAKIVGATHAVDDRIDNVLNLQVAGVDAYLMNQPHNASLTGFPVSRRVDSAAEFVDRILG